MAPAAMAGAIEATVGLAGGAARDNGYGTTILRPSPFVGAKDGGTLLAVADRLHPILRDAERGQILLDRIRWPLTEREVVFARPTFVGRPSDRDGGSRIFPQASRLL